jgi:hypothetical protein
MSRNKNHSSRKVIVAITGALMGIVAGSVGTVYAQGNNINPVAEMRNNETEDHLNKLNNLNEIASKSIDKAAELLKYEKNEKNIINEKIDWESINGREFLNQIKSNVENADKEQEIKRMWLTTINGLLAIYPDNENLRKIKTILEEDIKKDENSSEGKKENQEAPKVEDKKETKKDENSSGDKKRNEKTPKSDDKKEVETTTIEADNNVLTAKLSGRDVTVSFDKNKINADAVFVGAINDEKLNEKIINKLGNEYKVVKVFEIHFTKDGKKLDSEGKRTVKVSVVKNNDAKLEVYHIADNNVLEKIDNSKFSNGVVEFTVNHFSKFAILERIRVGAKDLESRVQIVTSVKAEYNEEKIATTKNSNVNNKKENEDLPKTGLETTETLGIALLALGTAIAIRRRQMQ